MARRKRAKAARTHETTVPKAGREELGIQVGSVPPVTKDVIVYHPIRSLENQAGSLSKYASIKRVKASLDRSRRVEH